MKIHISFYYQVCAASVLTVDLGDSGNFDHTCLLIYQICYDHLFVPFRDTDQHFHDLLIDTVSRLETIVSRDQIYLDANMFVYDWDEIDDILREDFDEHTTIAFTCNGSTVCAGEEGSVERFLDTIR